MELKQALDCGYELIATEDDMKVYSNINSDENCQKGKCGYLIQYRNDKFCGMIYISIDMISQIYKYFI